MAIIHFLSYALFPMIMAITVHEAAHALAAHFFGDSTAKRAGRVTLNPLPHIDWLGTVALPILSFISSLPLIGWAKPVPVYFDRLRGYPWGAFWVAAAGPLSNLVMGIFWFIALKLSFYLPGTAGSFLFDMSHFGRLINFTLFAFNLIPLVPFDGGRMVYVFAPLRVRQWYDRIEPYSFWIVLALAMSGLISLFLSPWFSVFKFLGFFN